MGKKFLAIVCCLLFVFCPFSVNAQKEKPVIVKLNGVIMYLEQNPVIENGTALVPFRAVLEKMGASVEWNSKTKVITCHKKTKTVKLTIGSNKMQVNNNTVNIDVSPKIVNNYTLIPLRIVAQAFDAEVEWDSKRKVIEITTDDTTQKDILKAKVKNTGTQSQLHSIINRISQNRANLNNSASQEFVTIINQVSAFERTVKSYGNVTDVDKIREIQNQYKRYINLLLDLAYENGIDLN